MSQGFKPLAGYCDWCKISGKEFKIQSGGNPLLASLLPTVTMQFVRVTAYDNPPQSSSDAREKTLNPGLNW
jgi:hypothetical protein